MDCACVPCRSYYLYFIYTVRELFCAILLPRLGLDLSAPCLVIEETTSSTSLVNTVSCL